MKKYAFAAACGFVVGSAFVDILVGHLTQAGLCAMLLLGVLFGFGAAKGMEK